MNHMFDGITAEKIKNGEQSIIGNLSYGLTIKLSAASIILLQA